VTFEASFVKGADEHFEVALEKAEEYLNMSDEAFVEAESMIGELETHVPEDSDEGITVDEEAQELKARAARHSLPVGTASSSDPSDRMTSLSMALPKPKLHGIKGMTR